MYLVACFSAFFLARTEHQLSGDYICGEFFFKRGSNLFLKSVFAVQHRDNLICVYCLLVFSLASATLNE